MQARLLLAVLLIGSGPPAWAESLELGGIKLTLGQKVDDALRLLSPYQIQYVGGTWLVTQKNGSEQEILGQIGAKENVVTLISKSFHMKAPEDAPEAYARASEELRHLGGKNCTTREVAFPDGKIRAFETQCGAYTLTYHMPAKLDRGVRALGAVTIVVLPRDGQ